MISDLRVSTNIVSEVIQNRPPPLREFDQIYMKVGDLTAHSHFIAGRFAQKKTVFIGDGDGVALSIANLLNAGALTDSHAPQSILVLDFDERICHSINDFARRAGISHYINAELYNVANPIEDKYINGFGAFHINPPYGQYNQARSAIAFMWRGLACLEEDGLGCCLVADNRGYPWTRPVLRLFQKDCVDNGCVIEEINPEKHEYHLEDAVNLTSCALLLRLIEPSARRKNRELSADMKVNFYGRGQDLTVNYIQRTPRINETAAQTGSYELKF